MAQAAALWESLSQNHPFIDGNKRLAFAAVFTFLRMNGVTITAEADAVYRFLATLYAEGELTFARLEAWLRRNTAALGEGGGALVPGPRDR